MKKTVAIVLLFLAAAQFAARSYRHRDGLLLWDFGSVYSAARAWIGGADPYDIEQVRQTWRATEVRPEYTAEFWSAVYPPPTLLMLAPLGALPAPLAFAIWALLLAALVGAMLAALLDLAGLTWREPRGLLLIGGTLASAPMQFGLLSGQPSVFAAAVTLLGIWCCARARDALGGVLIGLACAFKPHVAVPFLAYYLVLRRWRVVAVAGAIVCVIVSAALIAMQLSQPNWIAQWIAAIQHTTASGAVNDHTRTGPFRDQIMDLQLLLVAFLRDPLPLRVAIACVVALLLAWFVRAFPRQVNRSHELLPLAALAALSLLPVYHRVYDGALLSLALAWAVAALGTRADGAARAVLVVLCVFLIPFDVLNSIAHRIPGDELFTGSWWWHALVVPHYAWGLLAVTLCLLWAMQRRADALAGNDHPVQVAHDHYSPAHGHS